MDLVSSSREDIEIPPGETRLIPTGISLSIPPGYEAEIRPRSGLALKHKITLLNSPGTVDSDYRGTVSLIVTNFGGRAFVVTRGMRLAQMVIQEIVRAELEVVSELDPTERSVGGFGHTGHGPA